MIHDVSKFSIESLKNTSDQEVLALSRTHPEAFAVLMHRYEEAFLRKAESIVRVREDAEEVVQDTFTRIYVYADRYTPQEGASFSSWAYMILTRLAFTRYQKLKKTRIATQEIEPEVYERLEDRRASDEQEAYLVQDAILVALSKLPEQASHILRLQFLEGKTQEEIALVEGSTVAAVKTRVHRAKKLLKQELEK